MDIDAIFFDMDGTLLESKIGLSKKTKYLIKALEANEIIPVIATGRSYEALTPIKEELGITSPVICYNGAALVNGKTGETMTETGLSDEITRKAIEFSREKKIQWVGYASGRLVYEKEEDWAKRYIERVKIKGHLINPEEENSLNFTKALILDHHPEKLANLRKRLEKEFGNAVSLTMSNPQYLEIMEGGVNKGNGVKDLCKLMKWPLEKTMAFGDGMNDLEMLQTTGIGVVMENGAEELKALFPAKQIAPPCLEDGLYHYLKDHFSFLK